MDRDENGKQERNRKLAQENERLKAEIEKLQTKIGHNKKIKHKIFDRTENFSRCCSIQ